MDFTVSFTNFLEAMKKGEEFNVLTCSQLKPRQDSLPSAYLRKDKCLQYPPLSIAENIEENFLRFLPKFIDKNKWTFLITNEGLFNIMKDVGGFCPFEKDTNIINQPSVFESIIEVFQIYSKIWAKTIFVVNLIYSKTKTFDDFAKKKSKKIWRHITKNLFLN